MRKLSVVIPVYYNSESLPVLYERLNNLSGKNKQHMDFEFIFVDDGSGDNSFDLLKDMAKADRRIKLIKLSRNFGSFVACIAGLTYSRGDCAAIISADLQDPPELLEDMYKKWLAGSEVVLAVRKSRQESWLKVCLANIYYFLTRLLALRNMPRGGFDFVLIDRKVIDILVDMKEKNTTLMGQILWVGFKQDLIYYTKQKRLHGKSRWTFSKKIKYFIDTFVAFSYFPIRLMSFLGLVTALVAFLMAVYAIIKKIYFGVDVPGFTTLLVVILFSSGVQMIMLGLLGEYLWRNFDETRKRPLFIVDKTIGVDD